MNDLVTLAALLRSSLAVYFAEESNFASDLFHWHVSICVSIQV